MCFMYISYVFYRVITTEFGSLSHSTAHVVYFLSPLVSLLVPGTVTCFPLRVSPVQLVDRRVQGGERAE